ncbi:hypothetical protein [Phyllobacterium endophyticum]|uniref:hypothetical protein n=1 Tax=Phyllobacterium endophyticum TaxID=1149773 RepID=UPI001FEF5498|nr:hypothetical protein [Phyllobacterium endophyticum]
MSFHSVIVDGPLALRMQRLNAAREGATGRQIPTIPLLAARLAGGFIAPASQEILYPAIRQALDAGGYEDISKVSGLPGMPSAVLSALRSWWDAGIPNGIPDNLRFRDFTLLERRVRETLPRGALAPPDLIDADPAFRAVTGHIRAATPGAERTSALCFCRSRAVSIRVVRSSNMKLNRDTE